MTGFELLFVDTAPFIYALESEGQFSDIANEFFECCAEAGTSLFTSVITVEEYLVGPYRDNNVQLVNNFWTLLSETETTVVNIDRRIADNAAKMRAKYRGFKGMDSLQIAAAMRCGCDFFVTNDKQLRQTEEIRCITLEEFVKQFL